MSSRSDCKDNRSLNRNNPAQQIRDKHSSVAGNNSWQHFNCFCSVFRYYHGCSARVIWNTGAGLNLRKERSLQIRSSHSRNTQELTFICLWISISGFESLGGSQTNASASTSYKSSEKSFLSSLFRICVCCRHFFRNAVTWRTRWRLSGPH